MALTMRPPFNAATGFRAARSFIFLGVKYESGDSFDWRSAGCSLRRLQQLYERRRLRMPTDEEVNVSSAVPAEAPPLVKSVVQEVTPVLAKEKVTVTEKPKKRRGRPPKDRTKISAQTSSVGA